MNVYNANLLRKLTAFCVTSLEIHYLQEHFAAILD